MAASGRSMKKVIVVGGGLAGLGAANVLCKDDRFEVTLLEGDSELGGRIKTVQFKDGTKIALGCSFLHGTRGNSLYSSFCHKMKNEDVYPSQEVIVKSVFSDGSSVPLHVSQEIESCLESALNRETILNSPLSEGTLYDYLCATFLPQLKDIITTHKLNSFDPVSLFEGFLSYLSIGEGSKYVRDIRASTYAKWQYLDGDECLFITGNPFQVIIDTLSSTLPDNVVQLNSIVTNIDWSHDTVTVTVNEGELTYSADHVIMTVSLGVLKELVNESFFHPILSANKTIAINELGSAVVNKIILQFDGRLFDDKHFVTYLHWTPTDKQSSLLKDNPWLSGLHLIDHYPTNSNNCFYYIGWLCDDDALAVESVPRTLLKEILCDVVKKFYGQECPNLLDVVVSSWSNKFTRGSYSYTPAKCCNSLRGELACPTDDRLKILFAGEATSSEQYSTSHAAYDTGIREARKIVEYYNIH